MSKSDDHCRNRGEYEGNTSSLKPPPSFCHRTTVHLWPGLIMVWLGRGLHINMYPPMAAESTQLLLVNSSPGLSIRMGDAQLVIELSRSQRVRDRYWLKIIFTFTLNYLEVLRSILISFSFWALNSFYWSTSSYIRLKIRCYLSKLKFFF